MDVRITIAYMNVKIHMHAFDNTCHYIQNCNGCKDRKSLFGNVCQNIENCNGCQDN